MASVDLAKLSVADARTAAERLTAIPGVGGVKAAVSSDLLVQAVKIIDDPDAKLAPAAREAALAVAASFAEKASPAGVYDGVLVPLLPNVFERVLDKAESTRNAAVAAGTSIVTGMAEASLPALLPVLLWDALNSKTRKWQSRVQVLGLFSTLSTKFTCSVSDALPTIIPRLTELMTDARPEVAKAAEAALATVALTVGNMDIEKVVPQIISAVARPTEVPETIHALSSTTFVQAVTQPTLALLVPLLARGIIERNTPIKRMTAVIIANMAKLVPEKSIAAPLLPLLLPAIIKLRDEVADAECRTVATKALETLLLAAGVESEAEYFKQVKEKAEAEAAAGSAKAGAGKSVAKKAPAPKTKAEKEAAEAAAKAAEAAKHPRLDALQADALKAVEASLVELKVNLAAEVAAGAERAVPAAVDLVVGRTLEHFARIASSFVSAKTFSSRLWTTAGNAVLTTLLAFEGKVSSEIVVTEVLDRLYEAATGTKRVPGDEAFLGGGYMPPDAEEEALPDLCNCEFSLAYGGKILLNTAGLHLKKGKRYGLVGRNGCGKSTLMKAISNGQLQGFPGKDIVKTCYVEHGIQTDLADLSVLEYALADPEVKAVLDDDFEKATKAGAAVVVTPVQAAAAKLTELGFTDAMQAAGITSLSGGWKMKLALGRAMLMRADIYLLDEPTNHLDVQNCAWLTKFLQELKDVTSMIVSHDSGFLDAVCTHMVHYEGFKLRMYRGNLTELVKHVPAAKAYYELSETEVKFVFPEPGFLEGIKSKDRAILKVSHATYTYPTRTTPSLTDATVNVSLSSRVVVHGRNGAGKSTLIKLMTNEVAPQSGSVWKHPNLRLAYVSQDAFHHILEHLEMTPVEYIQWRYATGEDREASARETRKLTEEEEKKIAQAVNIAGVKMVVQEVLGRRKGGKSYEYEVSFVGFPLDKNQYLPREWLEASGFGKLCDAVDAREAAAAGLHSKPLTSANISKHLENLGLEAEFSQHHRMAGLSGGQKVKVVLGAGLWPNPHVVIMDEPSNYLDRDSLGALAAAIKSFNGGVVLVTHHTDFTKELCGETWSVVDGKVSSTGQTWVATAIEKPIAADEVVDAAGNVIKIAPKLSSKELKKLQKEKAARKKKGEDVSDDDWDGTC